MYIIKMKPSDIIVQKAFHFISRVGYFRRGSIRDSRYKGTCKYYNI